MVQGSERSWHGLKALDESGVQFDPVMPVTPEQLQDNFRGVVVVVLSVDLSQHVQEGRSRRLLPLRLSRGDRGLFVSREDRVSGPGAEFEGGAVMVRRYREV